jgi:hypothetical protein
MVLGSPARLIVEVAVGVWVGLLLPVSYIVQEVFSAETYSSCFSQVNVSVTFCGSTKEASSAFA